MKIWITKDAETEGIRCAEVESPVRIDGLQFHAFTSGRVWHRNQYELTEARAREVVRDRVLQRRNELSNEVLELEEWLLDGRNPKVVRV